MISPPPTPSARPIARSPRLRDALHALRTALLALVSLLACLASSPAFAQQQPSEPISVAAGPDREQVYLGDSFRFEIQITGSRDALPPDLRKAADADIEYAGPQDSSMVSTTIINGRVSTNSLTRYSFLYSVTPNKPGPLTIPSITVVVAGKPYTTEPVTVKVIEVPLSADVALEAELDSSAAYVGQPVRLRLTWLLGRNVRGFHFVLPTIDGVDMLPGPDAAPPGSPSGMPGYLNVRIGNDDQRCRVESRVINGRNVNAVIIDRALIPRRAGSFTIPPIRVDFNAEVGKRQRGVFDTPWDDLTTRERQHAITKPLTLSVRDLPSQGRPRNFSGLVGDYSIAARVDRTDASVGEPLNFAVEVTGPHPMSLVPPLDLASQPIAKSFKVPRDPILSDTTATTAVFSSTIRPRSTSASAVPPIELNYFDPKSGSYQIARSKPIPLSIKQTTTIGLDDSSEDDQSPAKPAEPAAVAKPLTNLIAARPASLPPVLAIDPLQARRWDIFALLGVIIALPLALGVLAALVRARRDRHPDLRRRKLAYSAFKKDLSRAARDTSPAAADHLAGAVRRYVARATHDDAPELTAPEAVDRVRTARGHDRASELQSLLVELDSARFAPASTLPERSVAAQRARAVVSALHKDWKSGGSA